MDRRTNTEIKVAKELIHTAEDKALGVVKVAEVKATGIVDVAGVKAEAVLALGEEIKDQAEKRASQMTQQLFEVVHSISSEQKEIRKILEGQNTDTDRSFDTFNSHVEADMVWQNGMQKSFDALNDQYTKNGYEWRLAGEQTKKFAELLEGHIARDTSWKEGITNRLDTLTADTAPVVKFSQSASGVKWMVDFIRNNIWPIAIVVGFIIYAIRKSI